MNRLCTLLFLLFSTTTFTQMTFHGDVTITENEVTIFGDVDDEIQLTNKPTASARLMGNEFVSTSVDWGNQQDLNPALDISVHPEEIVVTTPQGEAVWETIIITNEGTEALSWSASNDTFWLQLSSYSGIIYAEEAISLQVLLLISAMPVGEYTDSIIIESNDPDEGTIVIPIVAFVTQGPYIEFSPGTLDIIQAAEISTTHEIEIINSGSGSLDWNSVASIADAWIYPSGATSGSQSNGETAIAEITINTTGMAPGEYESDVVINSNAANMPQAIIHVYLTVEEGFVPTLEASVFDYDYCPGVQTDIAYFIDSSVSGNNVYTAEISDATGNFETALTIGQYSSNESSGEMSITIPAGLEGGNGYRIRVNSSNPVIVGIANESDITLHPWVEVSVPEINDICLQTPTFLLPAGQPDGGIWIGLGVIGNVFEPMEAGVGVHELSYEIETNEGCISNATVEFEVTPTPQVELSELGPYCENSATIMLNASPPGGAWIGNGISSGVFSPSEAGAGEHELTYIYAAGGVCAATGSIVIEVFSLPEVTIPNQGDYCEGDELIPLYGASPAGGEYWGDGVLDNFFDSEISGTGTFFVNYTYTDNIGCSNTVTASITIYSTPEISFETPESICENADPIQVVSDDQNCAFSGDGMIGDTFFPALAGIGSHTIHCIAITQNGCQSEASADIMVVASPSVGIIALESICENSEVIALDMGSPDGGVYQVDGVQTSFIDPSEIGVGVHSLTYSYGEEDCTSLAVTSFEIVGSPSTPLITYDGIMLNSNEPEGNQWYLDGQVLNGAIGSSLLPEQGGDYSVQILFGGCISELSNTITITITGIDDIEDDGFSVYPIPFDDKLIIVANERWPDETQFRLYDNSGRLVHFSKASTLPYSNGKYIYKESLAELPRGQYFLLIMLNGGIKRAMIQK